MSLSTLFLPTQIPLGRSRTLTFPVPLAEEVALLEYLPDLFHQGLGRSAPFWAPLLRLPRLIVASLLSL